MERRTRLQPMSTKRRQQLAEQGNTNPFSTLPVGAPLNRAEGGRFAALDRKPTKNTGPTAAVRTLVDARSGGRCEWPGCPRPQQDRHHRLNRKSGGRHGAAAVRINGAAWLLAACRPHHERVTNPTGEVRVEAARMGWVLRENQDAESTPVLTRHHSTPVLLTAAGSYTTHSPDHDHQEVMS